MCTERQVTFDVLETDSGEVVRGRIASPPAAVTAWVERFGVGEVQVAVEAAAGWLFVSGAGRGGGDGASG